MARLDRPMDGADRTDSVYYELQKLVSDDEYQLSTALWCEIKNPTMPQSPVPAPVRTETIGNKGMMLLRECLAFVMPPIPILELE